MENSNKLINWTIENSKCLSLTVNEITGLKKYYPNLKDFSATCIFEGIAFSGRGSDEVENIAYAKAISEMIEKVACYKYNFKNTSGIAIHIDKETAIKKAIDELIERDFFLVQYLLQAKNIELESVIPENILSYFNSQQVSIKAYKINEDLDSHCIMHIATGLSFAQPFGIIFGLAFHENKKKSIDHSLIELLRELDHHITSNTNKGISESEFIKIIPHSFEDHKKLALDINYAQKYLASPKKEINLKLLTNLHNNSTIEELSLDFLPPSCPLIAVKAVNTELQELFSGPTTKEKINKSRFENLLNITIDNIKLNTTPHFFN